VPTNKNALIRYQTLNTCFSNPGRNYFIEDLLEECNKAIIAQKPSAIGIQKRQLFEDIKFMESSLGWNIPLERCKSGKRIFYRYSDPKFSINYFPVSVPELDKIKEAIRVLHRVKGITNFQWIQELYLKLDETFFEQFEGPKCINFESNHHLKGIDALGDLFQAILKKQVLKVSYQSFKHSKVHVYTLHPYYLKQYNNRWFLLGKNPDFETFTNLALDRIVAYEEVDSPFLETTIDFELYFESILGVTIPLEAELTKIIFHAKPSLSPYILTKPIHSSQKQISLSEGGLLFSIEVYPNYELENSILSFGEELEVLEPSLLRQKLQDRIYKMIQKYEEIQVAKVLKNSETKL
jgi:predicted DNA-binding transcriptional regulator YafY